MIHPGPSLFDTLPEHTAAQGLDEAADACDGMVMPAAVLAEVDQLRAEIRAREARLMALALTWADLHPVESIHLGAATVPGTEGELAIAGEGAPLVAEFCVAEFAAAMAMSTDAGRHYLGTALETRHRLPHCQRRLESGTVDPWRVRRVAEHTMALSSRGAAWVDTQVAPFLDKVGPAQLQRLVEEARRRFDPEPVLDMTEGQRHGLHVTLRIPELIDGVTATADLDATLDLADALDLDAALTNLAADLATAGCPEPHDVRRALALGELARTQLTLELTTGPDRDGPADGPAATGPAEARTTRPRRSVELVVHLTANPTIAGGFEHFATLDNTHTTIATEQLHNWLTVTGANVTVRPVLDLDQHIDVPGYTPSDALKRQVRLIHPTCVFPYCHRPATRCDCDHVAEHAAGGPTCTCNLAPLCRRHHRLKTHTSWTYDTLDVGVHHWRSPHGLHYRRDRHGTTTITGPPGPPC